MGRRLASSTSIAKKAWLSENLNQWLVGWSLTDFHSVRVSEPYLSKLYYFELYVCKVYPSYTTSTCYTFISSWSDQSE